MTDMTVLRRRPNLAAALVLLAFAIVFVGPGLLPGRTLSNSDSFWFKAPWAAERPATIERPSNPEFDDAPAVLQPFVRYTRRSLPEVPLWNPYIMAGRPFLADAQSAVFSPFSVPAYVLGFWTSLGWIAVLKLWLAAFGTYLLGRALGMGFAGALLAGVAYGFDLWLVTWLSYPHASVWALLPWSLLCADRAIRRPDLRGATPLAVVTALQLLCGHPESSFHAGVATVVFAALRVRGLRLPWRRPLLAVSGAFVTGLGLAALVVVPFAELLLRSADLHQRAGAARAQHLPRRDVLQLFFPDWQGRPTQTPLQLFLLARAFYVGALPLLLAVAGLVLRPRVDRLVTAALGAACMAVVLGVQPIFGVVVRLPVFSSGHNTRLAVLAMLGLALLAGWGLDAVLERAGDRRRRSVALAAAATVVAVPIAYAVLRGRVSAGAMGDALRIAWGFATPDAQSPHLADAVRGSAVVLWATFALVGLGLIALALRAAGRVRVGVLGGAAVLLAFADLARAGMGYNPAIERAAAVQPATPATRLVQRASPARFVATGDIPQDAMAMNLGLYETRGYDLPLERRFDRLWRRVLSPEFPSQVGPYPQNIPLSLPKVTPYRLHLLGVLGTRYVMQAPDQPPLHVPGLRLVHPGPDARIYENGAEQPRAVVVGAQRVARDGEAALAAVADPSFDLRRAAITEQVVDGLPRTGRGGAAPAGTARITAVGPDRLDVRARADRAAMLVVSDTWDPGWTATVDGRDAGVRRVDYVLRGVRLGPGTHVVSFRYRPLSWTIGRLVTLVTALALAGALLLTWRRRRS